LLDHGIVPHEVRLEAIAAVGDKLWICECGAGRLVEFDPSLDKVTRTVKFTQSGFVIPDDRISSQGSAVTTEQDVMWLLDGGGGTITPVDTKSGEAGSALGIPRPVSANAFGFGALWLAADGKVHRVDMENGRLRTIELPDGLIAGGVALDEQAGVVWVSTCLPALADFADSPDPCRSDSGGG
jgi:streptogramin lyase